MVLIEMAQPYVRHLTQACQPDQIPRALKTGNSFKQLTNPPLDIYIVFKNNDKSR